MYEQIAHAELNRILDRFDAPPPTGEMRIFYTRLGANFYAIYSLFSYLYREHRTFERELIRLVSVLAQRYQAREEPLRELDRDREHDHEWFLD
ncbi:MAG: alpha-amylase, partial [Gammaproteobacteria bacterium]